MIRKLILENFMAHGHTELPLGPGVTVLIGPNNVGKSAVVEALRCLATNQTAKGFIRHGAKEARVEVELDDGTRISWRRKPNTAFYQIQQPGQAEPSEPFTKLGRGSVPEDVQKLLRLDKVDVEAANQPIDVHLGNQRHPIFLLDQPGATQAGFFAASSEAAHLLNMQNLLKAKVREARNQETASMARMERLIGRLDSLAGLPDLSLRMAAAGELLESLESLEGLLPEIENKIGSLRRLSGKRVQFQTQDKILRVLNKAPDLYNVQGLQRRLGELKQDLCEQAAALQRRQSLAILSQPPKLEEVAPLLAVVRGMSRKSLLLENEKARVKVLAGLEQPAELYPAAYLARSSGRIRLEVNRLALAGRRFDILKQVNPVPVLAEIAPLAQTADRLREMLKRRDELTVSLEQGKAEVFSMEDKVRERLKAVGACPLCGAELESERFLGGGHGHIA